MTMIDDEDDRPKSPALQALAAEALDDLSGFELEARIDALKAEISRCEAEIKKKAAGRAAADALFSS